MVGESLVSRHRRRDAGTRGLSRHWMEYVSAWLFISIVLLLSSASRVAAELPQFPTLVEAWGGAGGGEGLFNYPMGVAVDAAGYMYVADFLNHRIQKLSPEGQFVTMWGEGQRFWPIAVAVAAGVVYVVESDSSTVWKYDLTGMLLGHWNAHSDIRGVATDGTYVYLTCPETNRILKLTTSGELIIQWGSTGSGQGQLDYPSGIALDPTGNVYVVDVRNARVQVFYEDGTFQRAFAAGIEANESWPMYYGIGVGASGQVVVSDPRGGRVLTFGPTGVLQSSVRTDDVEPHGVALNADGSILVSVLNVIGFHGVRKYAGQSYEEFGGFGVAGDGYFGAPVGVAVDAARGFVYVGDFWGCRIQKFTLAGEFLAGWGDIGLGTDGMLHPEGIAVDSEGNVYVNDAGLCRVKKFSAEGDFLLQFGRQGNGNGEFDRNVGIAVDDQGFIYVADMGRQDVQKFSPSGTFVAKWGATGTGLGQFASPRGIAVDTNGYVYVVDETGSDLPTRVQKFTADGDFVASWDLNPNVSTGCPRLYGVTIDGAGHVYVVDTRNRLIFVFTAEGSLLGEWTTEVGGEEICDGAPEGLGVDNDGNLYLSVFDTGWVMKLRLATPSTVAPGDLNGDGAVDLQDVRLCLEIAAGSLTGTAEQREVADVDGDGNVDLDDARILAEYVLGTRDSLPGGGT